MNTVIKKDPCEGCTSSPAGCLGLDECMRPSALQWRTGAPYQIDVAGNETRTIYEAHLLEKLKTAKVDAVTEFFKYMVNEGSGSDNGVDPTLDDFLVDGLLKPIFEHHISKLKSQ